MKKFLNKIILNYITIFIIICSSCNFHKELPQNKHLHQEIKYDFKRKEGKKIDTIQKKNYANNSIHDTVSVDSFSIINEINNKKIIIKKNTILIGKNTYLYVIVLNNDNNSFNFCEDPICGIILLQQGNLIKWTYIPMVEGDELELIKKKNNDAFIEYYSSPAGVTKYYIIDTKNLKMYQTEFLEETERLIKINIKKRQAFKFRNDSVKPILIKETAFFQDTIQ